MNQEALITTLKSLKLYGMADSITSLAEQASPAYQQASPILETLLKAEVAEREVRSINYQIKVVRFLSSIELVNQLEQEDNRESPGVYPTG